MSALFDPPTGPPVALHEPESKPDRKPKRSIDPDEMITVVVMGVAVLVLLGAVFGPSVVQSILPGGASPNELSEVEYQREFEYCQAWADEGIDCVALTDETERLLATGKWDEDCLIDTVRSGVVGRLDGTINDELEPCRTAP